MPIIGDVFGLTSIYERQVENIDNNNFESWPESATYGYFGGGQAPGPSFFKDTIDRIDFSNETTSAPGNNLPQGKNGLGAVSSSSYGYFGGGGLPVVNTINRIDFSNETISTPTNNLSQASGRLAAVSSSSYGYFGGGITLPFNVQDTIDRIDFSNETASPVTATLSEARYALAAVSSSSYGYFGGGLNPFLSPSYLDTVDRIDFSNETTSAPGENLPQGREFLAAVSGGASQRIKGSRTYGYFGGGKDSPAPSSRVDTVDRIDFSNETISPVTATLPQETDSIAANSSSFYGYFGGGEAGPGSLSDLATINRLDFSNETMSLLGNNLPQGREELAALSSSSYGYFGGGYKDVNTRNTIDRIDFSNETTSAPGNNLTQQRAMLAAVSSSSYGYFGGGNKNLDFKKLVDRIDFTNETTSAPGNDLDKSKAELAALSSSSYGYFAGGEKNFPPPIDTVERLDFSNETMSLPGNDLSQERGLLAAVSSSSYGYFGGGENSPPSSIIVTTVDRIDFSNETISAPGNNLSQARERSAAVSN